MTLVTSLLAANVAYAETHARLPDAQPAMRLAVITCMDARIDALAALGLSVGDAHVLRNAGGRVTDDVLRSLALSSHVLGVSTVIVMQHTRCGLTGVSEEELHERTGASLDFLTIADHATTLRDDIDRLVGEPYLEPIRVIAGFVYDVDSGRIAGRIVWERPNAAKGRDRMTLSSAHKSGATSEKHGPATLIE